MAALGFEDDTSDDSDLSQFSQALYSADDDEAESSPISCHSHVGVRKRNVVLKLINRQLFGRVCKNPRAKTERMFDSIYNRCKYEFDEVIASSDSMGHIFMGFTVCGRFFISYKEKYSEDVTNLLPNVEYELYVWQFIPGEKFHYVSSYRIFKHLNGTDRLDEITFMQSPSDPYKLICYGLGSFTPVMAFVTILTLPIPNSCKYCKTHPNQPNGVCYQGWCSKHGFLLHYMFSLANPEPKFDPHVSLAYPDHLVINTGMYIHILKMTTSLPTPQGPPGKDDEEKPPNHANPCNFIDTLSEISETTSDNFSTNSIVDAILEDFSEYDLEGSDCNKPFHELNISCEPLNVTGKSYHNTLVQNIVDPRVKRLQNSRDVMFSVPHTSGLQKVMEKSKIDKKTAEKAYEFTEENEKCEKLSSFRKKRLADKKYEFSEDNSENIVPFNSIRRERRYLYRSQNRQAKSPDVGGNLFLSPRSPGMRSPVQSPNSRNGQFSPGGARNICCTSVRNSPHYSKSPISPKDYTRKFNVYSPSLDSDCSDYESKLILRQVNNCASTLHFSSDHRFPQNTGLLIVDNKREESKWIKKVVRRYSSVDLEDGSLVSGQSRDDYNIPIDIPLIVQTLTDQQLDVVPEYKADQISEIQLIITQRTFDCDQFVHRRAQKLCSEFQLEFLHCKDYDVKLLHICPINGIIICHAMIKIGVLQLYQTHSKPTIYIAQCIFTWNIDTDAYHLIEPPDCYKLQPLNMATTVLRFLRIPRNNLRKINVMDVNTRSSKQSLRDYNKDYEIVLGDEEQYIWPGDIEDGDATYSDSE